MKTNYTVDDLQNMTVVELRRLSGRLNKEARKRAHRLEKHGYSGKMVNPNLVPVRGLRKQELISSIMDRSQRYLRDSRSTITGMRKFESKLRQSLKENYDVNIPRNRLSDFADFIDDIRVLWGSLKYASKYAVQIYEEMTKAGLTSEDIGKSFDSWKETESGMLDILETLRKLNEDKKKVSSGELLSKLKKVKRG